MNPQHQAEIIQAGDDAWRAHKATWVDEKNPTDNERQAAKQARIEAQRAKLEELTGI